MKKFTRVVLVTFAVIFSIAFVATTFTALLLRNIERKLLTSQAYKTTLREQQVYAQIPRVIAEQVKLSMDYNPCADNPFVCEGLSPELKTCLQQKIAPDRYTALTNRTEQPTNADMQAIQPCIEKNGLPTQVGWGGENPLPNVSENVQQCVKDKLGVDAYNQLLNNGRPPSEGEIEKIQPCFSAIGITLGAGSIPAFIDNLSVGDWETIIKTLAPSDFMQTMMENILDQVFGYLNGNNEFVVLDLTAIKGRIQGPAGMEAILQLIRAQPACTMDQQALMEASLNNQAGEMTICFPGENFITQWKPQIQQQLAAAVTNIPDQRVIIKPGQQNGQSAFGQLRAIRFIIRLFPAIPLGFLLLITLLVVRGPRSWLQWWGIPFFFAGAFSLGIGALASGILDGMQIGMLTGNLPAYISIGFARLAQDIAVAILHSITEGLVLGGVLLILAGLGMWIGSYFIRESKALPPAGNEPIPPAY